MGAENYTLTTANMPPHAHSITPTTIPVSTLPGTLHSASSDSMLAASNQRNNQFIPAADAAGSIVTMQANNPAVPTSPVGGNLPFGLHQPSLGMNFIICLYGIFPSRN